MKIVADDQIPFVDRVFSELGEVILRDGRNIDARQVQDADILLVRSVTRVNAELLSGSNVRFVASATSGIDHVDSDWLKQEGISFVYAPGCNARAVVEYVLSSLFVLAAHYRFRLPDKSVGIIGCGQVGSRLAQALATMGVRCLLNDPPLQEVGDGTSYCRLSDALAADIITLHVPLTTSGRYATRHMVNDGFLANMRPGAILVNTSRGDVVDEEALQQALSHRHIPVVLDVWKNEPVISRELLAATVIGTPHIAGYTIDARLRATAMIYQGLCNNLHRPAPWSPQTELAYAVAREISMDAGDNVVDGLEMAILSHYDVRGDAAALRQSLTMKPQAAGKYFDELRQNYPVRREFPATTIRLPATGKCIAEILELLGFRVERV